MSGTIDPPKIIVATLTINNYRYALSNLIPHTSVVYGIDCFNDDVLVKSITGLLEGDQYKEWMTDDWLDRFIKQKVEELPNVQMEPCIESELPITEPTETPVEEIPVQETPVQEILVEETPVQETPVQEVPVQETPVQETPVQETPVQETLVQETLVEETLVQETLVEEVPVEEKPL
jgi:hypothetical protein